MTVAAKPASASYDEDGASTSFPVPFRFKSSRDLIVERLLVTAGQVEVLALGRDYSVTGGATDAGGTVKRVAASDGAVLRIRRATKRAQPMVYTTGDRFPAVSHEEALDRQMLVAQEQDDAITEVGSRALLVPPGETAGTLPPLAMRVGGRKKVLAVDKDTGIIGVEDIDDAYRGDTGPANNSYPSIADLRAAKRSDKTYTLTTKAGPRSYNFVDGDFSALITPDLYLTHDFVALDTVPATQGALVLDRGTQRTLADFGAIGDGGNDTAAVQAGANWASAVRRRVLMIGTKGTRFAIAKLTIKTLDQFEGIHRRISILQALKLAAPPAGYYGLVEIDAGPVIECDFRDFRIEGLTADGTANPRQMGVYAYARRPDDPTAFPQGGMWYSKFTRVDIKNFEGHAAWFRGGSVDDPAVPGTYSFLLPHQFLRFEDCDIVRGGADAATAICLSGQCGQFLFKKTALGGAGLNGVAVSIGREFDGGSIEQQLVREADLYKGAFVAPGAIYFEQCTVQGTLYGILTDQANVFICDSDFESLRRAITGYLGNVMIDGNEFRSAGDYGGNGWLIGSFNANMSGRRNTFGGTTDRIWFKSQPHTARFDVEMIGAYQRAGQTEGTWLNTGVQPDGTVELGSARLCRIDGSEIGCSNITSGMLPGEYQDMYVTPDTGPLAILSSGTLEVPGGRLVLRGGDTLRVTRNDQINRFIFAATIGELRAGEKPATGRYYEGEFVRNVNSGSLGPGAAVLGWYRLTTGEGHDAGVDWRALQVTGV